VLALLTYWCSGVGAATPCRFTQLELLDRVAPDRPGWRRHVPAIAFLLMLVALITGFARPTADVRVPRERATVLSPSTPPRRCRPSTSPRAASLLHSRRRRSSSAGCRTGFEVGLVSFNRSAAVVVPATTDRTAVTSAIGRLSLGPSTAIGEAVYAALTSVPTPPDGADRPPVRIVLMSDGTNTVGRTPEEAAAAAEEAGVPVSTIAYGTPEGRITVDGEEVPVPVDAASLRRLAEDTGGKAYTAATGDQLRAVYDDIGGSVGWRTEERDVSAWFVGAGLLAALAAGAASLAWFSRLP
jgi:Ca-activated chloride channel family protein